MFNYKKLFQNAEANIKIKRVSLENQFINTVILVKPMYYFLIDQKRSYNLG
jgi:hypothetical protein